MLDFTKKGLMNDEAELHHGKCRIQVFRVLELNHGLKVFQPLSL